MLRVDRRWTALEAADEGREIAMRKGAEEMQKQLEPQFKQLLESHEEMKAERQLAAGSYCGPGPGARLIIMI